ncbi:DUF7507 domain-containing protein [Piscicoccus intestinalis]|uniref:DUF7507 domain-containing protein n=1 Tax=Piscicoccus intestinalis TaxID=746033 RepID=UPI0008393887|nr:hypothetical protein [Piscicoccus intestinalis]
MAPGATLTCAAPAAYVITRDDVNARRVVNTATVTGTGPGGTRVSAEAGTTTPLTPRPAIALDKAHTGGDAPRALGDVVTYTFTVDNVGAGTLRELLISDPVLGIDARPCTTAAAQLPSGEQLRCTLTGTHTVAQADVDGGRVDNTATVTALAAPLSAAAARVARGGGSAGGARAARVAAAEAPGDVVVTATDSDSVPVAAEAVAAIALVKEPGAVVDADADGAYSAGDGATPSR